MKIFNRTEDEILFDLIARDNPDLVPALSPNNCYIGPAYPNTDSDAGQYNTVATVIPRFDSGLYGRIKIKYNRIDLNDLFRGIQPVQVTGKSANQSFATRAEVPALFGQTYRIPIREGDVSGNSDAYFYAKPSAAYGKSVFKVDNNKCFIGQVYVGFSYDSSDSLASYFDGRLSDVLQLPAGVAAFPGHPEWPLTIGYFGDVDFTEVAGNIDHKNDITYAQAGALGLFMGRTFYDKKGKAFNPNVDYDPDNPFGYYGCWAKHVDCNLTSALVNAYPWIDTNYTHVKITKLALDPSTGSSAIGTYYFAFHYNRNYVV